jgi:hypothetical protein
MAVHALVAIPFVVLGGLRAPTAASPVTFEVIKVAHAAPAPEVAPPPAAPEPPVATKAAARPARRVARMKVASVAAAAASLPVPEDAYSPGPMPVRTLEPAIAPIAPPPPPAPPRPAFHDDGFDQLTILVQSWQHNDRVRACLDDKLGAGPRLEAIRRGDHAAALRASTATSGSFAALYQRARACLR